MINKPCAILAVLVFQGGCGLDEDISWAVKISYMHGQQEINWQQGTTTNRNVNFQSIRTLSLRNLKYLFFLVCSAQRIKEYYGPPGDKSCWHLREHHKRQTSSGKVSFFAFRCAVDRD